MRQRSDHIRAGAAVRNLLAVLRLVPLVLAAMVGLAAAQDKPAWLNQIEWDFVRAQKTITLAPDPAFSPVEEIDANGDYRGIAADYLHLLESKLGIRFAVVNLGTWDAVLEAAKARRVDLLPAAANTPNRQEFLLFSSPHLVFPGVIIVRNDVRGNLGLKDLYGKKVAIVSGYVWQELIQSDHPAVQIVPAPDLTAALQMASLGAVDAVVEALPVVVDVIGKAGIGNLRVAGETGFFTRLSFATRKDWPLLSSVIEKTLAEISPDERRAIFNKWIHLKADPAAGFPWGTFWSVVVSLGACAALFAAVAALWIRSLRHQVRARTAILDRQTAQLRESEERLLDFAESSSDWFWEMNDELVMTYMSPNFTTVTGVDVALVLGKDCDQLIAAVCGKVSIEEHKRHLRERLPYREFEFEIAIPGRASVFVSTSGRPAFDADGRFIGFRGTGNDITEKRKLQLAVAVAEARAHQAQKMEAIGQMTGGIAHDFNNLLQAILGNADFLENANPPGSQGHLAAQQIRLAGERAARLTKHLLAFARQQPLEPAPMNLGEVVDSLRPLLQRVLGESIALHCQLPAAPLLAVADRAQVESALVNLALNARDAMPGGGTFTVAVDAGTLAVAAGAGTEATQRACARMRVSDTGLGMSAAVKERAFEPFFTTKEVGKGTGLGLSMVFGFAKQSGGHAELESAPGRGTTVTILLPLAKAEVKDEVLPAAPETPAAPEMPAAPEAPATGGPATVLVVEDDPLVRAQVAMSIRSLGYEVIEVADGPAALQEIEGERRIDLLFTDIVMPGGMNGRELAAKACATRPGLRVLFTSGYSDNVFIRDGRREPGPRLLGKPYRRPDLARMLREVLEEDRPGVNGAAKPIASTA